MLWQLLTFGIISYTVGGLFLLALSFYFLSSKENKYQKPKNEKVPKIYIIIPLLREQKRLDDLFDMIEPILEKHSNVKLVLVTTQRELLENEGLLKERLSTLEMIEAKLLNFKYPEKVHSFHYPHFNKVVAEQLNYAVTLLRPTINDSDYPDSYLAFYNADSRINAELFDVIIDKLSPDKVLQQSSFFTSNIQKIFRGGNYLTACFGVYQSIWTIKHEIPRLLLASNYYNILPARFTKYFLNYCITHGLIIPIGIFDKIQGFPLTKQGGEDIAIGYTLRVHGYTIEPINNLENSDTPETFKSLWFQLANWYSAVLGYIDFHRPLLKNNPAINRKKAIVLSLQGGYDIFTWFFKGWIILAYLILGIMNEKIGLSIFILMLNLGLSLSVFFLLNNRISDSIFPRFKFQILIVFLLYPLVVIIRSVPAILGLAWFVKTRTKKGFIRLKTE